MGWLKEKEEVLAAAQRMLERGLVIGTAGNVSQRLKSYGGQSLLAITPSSRGYLSLSPEDIQVRDLDSRKVEGELPSSVETHMHISIYRARKDINAIIHTHSVFATATAVAGLTIPPITDEQVIYLGGEIKTAVYAPSGTPELAKNAVEALGDRNAVFLANHGAVAVGKDIAKAFRNAELLEKTAQIYLTSLVSGKVKEIPKNKIAAIKSRYHKVGKHDTI